MYCKYCGTKINDDLTFCSKCGKSLSTTTVGYKEKNPKKIAAITITATIFIGLLVTFLVLCKNPYYNALWFGSAEEKFTVAMKIEQDSKPLRVALGLNPYDYDKKTMKLLKQAADKGFDQACIKLGESYERRSYGDENLALEYYKKSADMGNAESALHVARMPIAIESNLYDTYSRMAAERGLGEGWSNLAGTPRLEKDFETAMMYYKKAVEAGYKDALYDMGYMCLYESHEYEKGLLYLKDAIQQGNTRAMCLIGYIAFENEEYDLSFNHFQMASDAGDRRGKRNLGFLYFYGIGVRKDYQTALALFKEASWNDPTSYKNGTELDEAKKKFANVLAFIIELNSSEQEFDILSYNDMIYYIGYMMQNGLGTNKDIDSARAWYEYAAALEQDDAKAALEKMNNN